MELSPELLFVIGLAASVVVWVVKVVSKNGNSIPDAALTFGVYVVSAILALLFAPVTFPPFPAYSDPFTFAPLFFAWLGQVIAILSVAVGFAGIIYQALLKSILDGLAKKLGK